MRVLNIDVPAELVGRWAAWFAPERQPFLLDRGLAARLSLPLGPPAALTAEERDTFGVYGVPDDVGVVRLAEQELLALPRGSRTALVRAQLAHGREQVPSVRAWGAAVGAAARTQADGHRFVWWPTLLAPVAARVLTEYVEEDRRPSRHREVSARTWTRVSDLLPGARSLAGTFPGGSGPNCFGTVMAAAGVPATAGVWVQRAPFEEWLRGSARPGGADDAPGTVLVWRSADGRVQHAAVTLGDGWALHKPSQGWYDPVKVLTVAGVKRTARTTGHRLERWTLTAPSA